LYNVNSVLIDDIDRVTGPQINLFPWLDSVGNSSVYKLIFLTANNINKIPPALYRPGRISRVATILGNAEQPIRELLAPLNLSEDTLTEVTQWPIAYAASLRKSLEVSGIGKLEAILTDLRLRVKACQQEYHGLI